ASSPTNGVAPGARTTGGERAAEPGVIAPGWGRRGLAASVGAPLPPHAAEHFYVVTEPIAGLPSTLPVLRDPDSRAYFKEDAGKLLIGWFEAVAKPWGMDGIPESFAFDQLPADLEHIEPLIGQAGCRGPALAKIGIQA